MQLFWTCVAIMNFSVGVDAVNAFAQSPPPAEPTFVRIDPQMREWLQEQKGINVEEGDVRPVLCALQDSPESGPLWADKVESYILGDLRFTTTMHEQCPYIGAFAEQPVMIGRQVDDFKVAAKSVKTSRALIKFLQTKIIIEAEEGIMSHYNGIHIVQARDYVNIHVGTYIDKLLENHGWETPYLSESHMIEPIHPSAIRELEETEPPATLAEAAEVEKSAGFPYRNAVGELLYAYMTCRLDIGYAIGELSKFSTRAAPCHFTAIKRVY
jgi:hypothetical protein